MVTPALFNTLLDEEMAAPRPLLGAAFETGRFAEAIRILSEMSLSETFEEFLTLPAYEGLA
jgi:malate synthase